MSEMVERVAKALCEIDAREMYPHEAQAEARKWYIDSKWDIHIDAAKAAIAALSEPTQQMLRAGFKAAGFASHSDYLTLGLSHRAMIAAALASEDEGKWG